MSRGIYKRIKPVWNKGKKGIYSEEYKKKISRLGDKLSEETKKKMSIAHIGRKNSQEHNLKISEGQKRLVKQGLHNWGNGTKTSQRLSIYGSRKYINWRIKVFQRDNYTCTVGGKKHGNKLQAHHIKPFAYYPELRFELSNGRTLCKSCHYKTDTYGSKAYKLLK